MPPSLDTDAPKIPFDFAFIRVQSLWQRSNLSADDVNRIEILMPEGIKMLNPMHMCFDSTMFTCINNIRVAGLTVVHGIGMSNMPEEAECSEMSHSWLEVGDSAYDTTWGVMQPKVTYRNNLCVSYLVEYTVDEALKNWDSPGLSGPWDDKIIKVTKEYDARNKR